MKNKVMSIVFLIFGLIIISLHLYNSETETDHENIQYLIRFWSIMIMSSVYLANAKED
jgi:hypothetical protein